MRVLFFGLMFLAAIGQLRAETAMLSDQVKATLIFREDISTLADESSSFIKDFKKLYPHPLKVFLRLETTTASSEVSGSFKTFSGIVPELLDERAQLVQEYPWVVAKFNDALMTPFVVPYDSCLDLCIPRLPFLGSESHKDEYLLMVGYHRWFVPIKTASHYSLRIKVFGFPQTYFVHVTKPGRAVPKISSQLVDQYPPTDAKPQLLIDVPSVKIEMTK